MNPPPSRRGLAAARLRATGAPWTDVARAVGYHDRSTARKAARAAVERREAQARRDLAEVRALRAAVYGQEAR